MHIMHEDPTLCALEDHLIDPNSPRSTLIHMLQRKRSSVLYYIHLSTNICSLVRYMRQVPMILHGIACTYLGDSAIAPSLYALSVAQRYIVCRLNRSCHVVHLH